MNSHLKFLRRVRIHGGECGAVARALHHEVKTLSLPAVEEKVSFTTNERKSMNKKTSFKRIALAVVAALGFGVLSTGPTQAVPFSHTLTIDSATDSAYTLETATAVLTNVFSSTDAKESTTIRYTCSTAVGNTCPAPTFYQTPTSDTSNVNAQGFTNNGNSGAETSNFVYSASTWTDSIVATTAPARSVTNVKAAGFANNGTYTYTFYTTYAGNIGSGQPSTIVNSGQSVTWTVTVAGGADRQTADTARVYISADGNNGEGTATAYDAWKVWGAATDSAIVANRGTTTPAIVGVAFIRPFNAAGDTAVVVATGGTKNSATAGTVDDSITVEVSGPGYVSSAAAATTTYSKSVVVNAQNKGSLSVATESITILSDGTAGVATITFKSRSNKVLATKTVTFTGGISSISQAFFVNAETTVSYTGTYSDTVTITAYVKDSAGTIVKSSGGLDRNLYLFSSDTAVVGDINGASLPTGRVSTCTVATTTGLWTCMGDIRESGTVTLTLRDSLTVTASTVSLALDAVTVVGNTLKTMTAAYDKTTYAPGERAVLTIKGLDTQGKVLSGRGNDSGTMNKIYASAWTLVNTSAFAHTASTSSPYCGTVGVSGGACATYTNTTYSPFKETGMETVVVTMPTASGEVTYEFRNSLGVAMATISATVVNPQDDLVNAATDAAAEAIDAANAATDAANLAAEAADAATVAAEEARDAADAATAAVEELATAVATLMAALKAQVTTLANTVAKIAKKVGVKK
jgi:trimeric autotransporter adhesin